MSQKVQETRAKVSQAKREKKNATKDPELAARIKADKDQKKTTPVYKATQWSQGIEKDVRSINDQLDKMKM